MANQFTTSPTSGGGAAPSSPSDLLPTITTAAAGPRSATSDGNSATAHSLPDQITADKYAKASAAVKRRPLGIRFVKLRPGGNADYDRHGW